MRTLEEIKELIKNNIEDPEKTASCKIIAGIYKIPTSMSFFSDHVYVIRKSYTPNKDARAMNQLNTFYNDDYVQPLLDFLNSYPKAVARLPRGMTEFKIIEENNPFAYTNGKDTPFTVHILPPNKYSSQPKETITLQRTDSRAIITFKNMDDLFKKVFSNDSLASLEMQAKIGNAIKEYFKKVSSELHGAETRLKNAQEKFNSIKQAFDNIPDDIKLLMEINISGDEQK